ncbi:type II toxin-antitoxin system antitoxin SocA domain-containing protein [Spiroplasma sp. SV19]|uniref:type II toxin-antitoxin system antitoxin SocA domain-containing protein n=1 Tax=Spiroplasma sp. SV19 TaxID=2570468 RepID=UPI0024B69B5F|nr:type II toxin-antitoxin system antitoxin SocA domain-containing protein [Spiroplasma sp. SV19]WHQ36765.1 DUF4065 domain-containing protein [Spiroplasma sp. SV19]
MLYKIMHLAQVFFLILNNEPLFDPNDEEAWTNGPVIKKVRISKTEVFNFTKKMLLKDEKIIKFIDKIYEFFKDSDSEDLYEITHWDPAYNEVDEKKRKIPFSDQKMDVTKHLDLYKKEFKLAIEYFKNM